MKQTTSSPAIKQVLHDYWQLYKTHRWWTLISFVTPGIGTILIFYIPPLIVAKLIDTYILNNGVTLSSAGSLIVLFAGSWLLGEVFWRIGLHYLIKLEAAGVHALSNLAFERLTDRDYDFYTNNFVGSLAKKAAAFARSFEIFTDTLSFNIITNILPLLFAFIILWRYSPLIPILLLFCLGIVVAVAIPLIRKRSRLVTARHDASSQMVGRLSDALTNMPAIKSFAKEEQEKNVYSTYTARYTDAFTKAANFQNLRFDISISPLYVTSNVIGLLFTVFFAETLALPASALVVVFSYYSQVTRIFWEINRIYRNIESSITEAAEFTELFLTPTIIQDKPKAKKLSVKRAAIQFTGVHFGYQDSNRKDAFLYDFNITIPANQKVGLVGPSGSGKTTITRLLLRFIDVQQGAISIDGQNIKSVTQKSLREHIAYVPQEPLLFHRSMRENIAYGNEKATEKEILRASKLAHAHDFIVDLPDGYDTLVGERGIKLSGGQRQRVAIARALLKNAPILILDEATSALDSESEKYIQDGFKKLMKNKTALVIAHRLSTIKHLDRIIVLDQGKIVQDGTHEELIQQPALYATLWGHQSGEFIEQT